MRSAGPWVTLVVLAAAGIGASFGVAPRPLVAAHRGGALLWPENSLLAFRTALALDVDYLECDVHLTADGEVIVLHDPTLDRATTGRGAVREARLADLARLRLKARDGSVTGEPIPTLAALLDLLKPGRAELLLEIKVGADRRRYPGIEEHVLALVRARGLESRVLVMAFEGETVRRIRELHPAIRTVRLLGRAEVQHERVGPAASVTRAGQLGAAAVGIDHRLVDADVVAAARRAGLRLAAWTVNDEADIRRMIDLGVDVVISDRPNLALRLVGR
ncbi:MAG TPA: glycerophosphodiester phosphodiesterase family protein [Methylomirabilota bacterium]|nr:glycerophosphodiester phosphodiesterase family protein [Methylomirabilota bacterium]